jgi:N-acetylmuramoyl-L-alanine amidase
VDFVSLDQLASTFGLTLTEDTVVGGLTIRGRGQPILLIPGQALASIGPGRVVSLPAAVERDRGAWQVPVDFVRLALGPALGLGAEVRRATHLILVGDVRLPEITGRFERVGANARLVLEVQPATPNRVTREGNLVVVRFEATAIDLAPVSGLAPEFAAAVREDGTAVVVELGPSVTGYRVDAPDANHLAIDLVTAAGAASAAAAPAAPPAATRPPATDPPLPDIAPAGGLRTIVIDPGHGGADVGVRGPGGTEEKAFVLELARRVKAAIESRIGLRVLLTRDADEVVPVDRRTSLANNNKADLFISLHANASTHAEARGAQVLSLDATDYADRPEAAVPSELPVPLVSGGTRSVDIVPWDLAQIPFASPSASVAAILARHLGTGRVALYAPPTARLPLRPLVGANMPAVLVEVGFLTSPAEERSLRDAAASAAIVEAIVNTVSEVRFGIPAPAEAR